MGGMKLLANNSCSFARSDLFFVLKFADASDSRVCAGLHDTSTVCKSLKMGSKHFSSGDVYKL